MSSLFTMSLSATSLSVTSLSMEVIRDCLLLQMWSGNGLCYCALYNVMPHGTKNDAQDDEQDGPQNDGQDGRDIDEAKLKLLEDLSNVYGRKGRHKLVSWC